MTFHLSNWVTTVSKLPINRHPRTNHDPQLSPIKQTQNDIDQPDDQFHRFKKVLIVHCLPLPGQSNGYCSGDWDCSSTSSSPLPCPPTPTLPLPAGGHAGAPCPEHVHTFGDLRPWEWAAPHALHKAHNKVRLQISFVDFFCACCHFFLVSTVLSEWVKV